MIETRRTAKIGQLIQSRVALLFQKEPPIKNGLVTIMNVQVSVDLSYANLHLSLIGIADPKALLKSLNDKSAYYRIEIAKNWASKKVPQLKFVHDQSHEKAYELTHLIDTTLSNY
jgi:ribosome-binding factor A